MLPAKASITSPLHHKSYNPSIIQKAAHLRIELDNFICRSFFFLFVYRDQYHVCQTQFVGCEAKANITKHSCKNSCNWSKREKVLAFRKGIKNNVYITIRPQGGPGGGVTQLP